MSRERAALIRAVRKDPECQATRQVFADWLEEQADPLAGYVRAECAVLAEALGSRKWQGAMSRLLAVVEKARQPLGGWEFPAELKRLKRYAAEYRADLRDEDDPEDEVKWPPIPEPDLIRFEKRHGLTLPPHYRAFLLHVANGWDSVGMANEICALDLTNEHANLAKPFPPTRAEARAATREIKRWFTAGKQGLPRTKDYPSYGCVAVADFGCCNGANLVVRGEARGQVWSYVEVCGPFSNASFTRPLNYLEWFGEMVGP